MKLSRYVSYQSKNDDRDLAAYNPSAKSIHYSICVISQTGDFILRTRAGEICIKDNLSEFEARAYLYDQLDGGNVLRRLKAMRNKLDTEKKKIALKYP